MIGKREWTAWILHREEIEQAASQMEIDPASLSEAEMGEIARRFRKGVEWALCDDWKLILDEAIETTRGDEKSGAGL